MVGLTDILARIDTRWWATFIVGLLTGTFIGNVKTALEVYDRFRRPRIAIDRNLYGKGSGYPNVIRVTNLSPSPVLLDYWELVWRQPLWKFWTWRYRDTLIADNDGSPAITLEPLTPKSYLFGGEHWFDWGANAARGRSMVFRHSLIGEKRLRDTKLD
ncbi:MAG: hypothetical protein EOP20_01215 [Hyphomicrobiales bacterium]|nr:MAG: hypothetical protein EOP20_01215 [Hyphomicrobiales bacterium]